MERYKIERSTRWGQEGKSMKGAALALLLVASPAAAQIEVVDGDTIRIEGVRVQLFGIDAPEQDPAARKSAKHLRALIGRAHVNCKPVDYDKKNERPVMLCSINGDDVSLIQVRTGNAVVWCYNIRKQRPQMLQSFQKAEADAKAAKRGFWARPFRPWRDWGC
jgi:endonuclease YncB( thermonuclease family)